MLVARSRTRCQRLGVQPYALTIRPPVLLQDALSFLFSLIHFLQPGTNLERARGTGKDRSPPLRFPTLCVDHYTTKAIAEGIHFSIIFFKSGTNLKMLVPRAGIDPQHLIRQPFALTPTPPRLALKAFLFYFP